MNYENEDDDLDDALLDDGYHENENYHHEEEEGYDEEYFDDDFETSGGENHIDVSKLRQSPIIKPTSHHVVHEDENLFDDEDLVEQPQPAEAQEDHEGPNFEQESMTLESYMEEFFKRKYQEPNPDSDDKSPEAIDPQVNKTMILI